MKMTMHIDEELLDRVIKVTGAASKTEAVNIALREMDRKIRLAEFGKKGLGLTKAEIRAAVAEDDTMFLRVAEEPATPSPIRRAKKS
ncbi:MAG: type II toxin-antitoxin system VapB family antitoxin [Chthoniobacterales bacterium]